MTLHNVSGGQLKALRDKGSVPEEESILPADGLCFAVPLALSLVSSSGLSCRICTCQPHNQVSQFLKIKPHLYPSISAFLFFSFLFLWSSLTNTIPTRKPTPGSTDSVRHLGSAQPMAKFSLPFCAGLGARVNNQSTSQW